MNGYNFTDDVRRTLQQARESAGQLGSDQVEPVHILLGITESPGNVTRAVLTELGATSEQIAASARSLARPVRRATSHGPDLPYTRQAKRVLEDAMSAARRLEHSYVGCEHLLLALADPASPLAGHLRAAGLSGEAIEAIVRRTVPARTGPPPAPAAAMNDPIARIAALAALVLAGLALWAALRR